MSNFCDIPSVDACVELQLAHAQLAESIANCTAPIIRPIADLINDFTPNKPPKNCETEDSLFSRLHRG